MSELFEVVLNQRYFNQQCVTRLNYVGSGTPASVSLSFALISALGAIYDGLYPSDTWLAALADLVSDQVIFEDIHAENIYSVSDFYETPLVPAYSGNATGQAMSPTNAYGFTSSRIRTDIRSGQKRFVGVTESYVGAGGELIVSDSIFTNMAAKLGETLEYDDEGTTLTFAPVIVGKERYEVVKDGVPTGRFAYRYYEDKADQMDKLAQGGLWSPKSVTRTQASRQYGKGR